MIADLFSECVEWVYGWGGVSFGVSCGKLVKSVRDCVCAECGESFKRGQKIALVDLPDSGKSRVYHYGCLPREFGEL